MGEAITDNSPLLRNAISSNLPWVKKLKEVKPVKSFIDPIYRITIKAGLRTRTHNRQTQHKNMLDHAFRKFCNTKMIEARVEHNTKEFLLGHKVSRGLDNEYDRTPVHNRLSEYLKAVELLTISQENRLKKQNTQLKYTLAEGLAQRDQMIAEQQKQIEKLQKDMRVVLHANMRKSNALQDIELAKKLNAARKKRVM
jgi:hypothetical protein